jgi:membrane protease YdiL (CAAX protease family)
VGLSLPLPLLAIPLALRRLCGARLADLGLTTRGLGRSLLLGVTTWALATPVLLGLHVLVLYLYGFAGKAGTHEHAFEQLAQQGLWPAEWAVLVVAAVASAPIREELLFRGVLQPWFAKNAWGGPAAGAAAVAVAACAVWGRAAGAWVAWVVGGRVPEPADIHVTAADAAPVLFAAALAAVAFVVRRFSRTGAGPAIFGTSLLFAAVHSGDWPSPIALFPLALLLGWLACRTRSLAGPMALHGLFNAVSCALLLWR